MERADIFVERTDYFVERSDYWLERSDLNTVRPLPQFHGSFRSTTLIKKGFILVLRYTTFFPAFPWQEWPNYNRKIDNKRTHLWRKRTEANWKCIDYVSTVQVSQRMRRDEYHVVDSSKVIGLESPRNVVKMVVKWQNVYACAGLSISGPAL